MIARHLTITGRVQGVFYRDWTVEMAQAMGLIGWVRNRLSGDVEILVQGEAAALDRFIDQLRIGPPAAKVRAIHAADRNNDETLSGFEKRATV